MEQSLAVLAVGNSEMLQYLTTSALIKFIYDMLELWLLNDLLDKN